MTYNTIDQQKINRESFLDGLRIAATCAVVFLHTVTGVRDITDMSFYPLEDKVFLVARDLVTWCVPMFLIISGYLFLRSDRKIGFWTMLWKYCRRILFALFLFGVPFACLEQIATERTFRFGMIGESVLMICMGESWSHMWYLYLILALYLVTPALKYLLERCPRWLLYLVLAVLVIWGSIIPFMEKLENTYYPLVLPDSSIYLFYYLCGYLFAEKSIERNVSVDLDKGSKVPAMRSGITLTVLAATVLILVGMVVSRLVGNYSVQMAYNYPFTVLLSLSLFYLTREAAAWRSTKKAGSGQKAPTGIMTGISSLCFAVYLIHPLFVNIAYKLLHVTPLDFPIGVSLPLFFAVILGLSLSLAWGLRRIPGMAKYVL
ncbi:MAG: acyltransferase [Acetatifactor sp.]|nr:acyltransferase [Acetatifactor sp.]